MLALYPYSTRLKVLLSEHCKDPVEVSVATSLDTRLLVKPQHLIQVETRGVSGERVINEMSKRLDKVLQAAQQPYDWILFLGGKKTKSMNSA